ncbi:hypothetical protein [Deinococcus humi]|uniref:Uncharacterized protein n=1 Tax=Deinococcus humi TaxID=662880 RepID=A0A7W8NFP8_9DEIO|nr:hypothetical protein [Deinococcus humi]MBB5365669.1 hypothetical protein [Deinococcus humi]GGO37057.1 hypothetical protein GCM10008949_41750 [Deinococcus humi]
MSELPPSGATFSAPAHLFIKTERAALSAAEQPFQAAAFVNHNQPKDFKRREFHRADNPPTKLESRLDLPPKASTSGLEPHSFLLFDFSFQSPSARQQGIVGLPCLSWPAGGLE